jgi:hypothetical protein
MTGRNVHVKGQKTGHTAYLRHHSAPNSFNYNEINSRVTAELRSASNY